MQMSLLMFGEENNRIFVFSFVLIETPGFKSFVHFLKISKYLDTPIGVW